MRNAAPLPVSTRSGTTFEPACKRRPQELVGLGARGRDHDKPAASPRQGAVARKRHRAHHGSTATLSRPRPCSDAPTWAPQPTPLDNVAPPGHSGSRRTCDRPLRACGGASRAGRHEPAEARGGTTERHAGAPLGYEPRAEHRATQWSKAFAAENSFSALSCALAMVGAKQHATRRSGPLREGHAASPK